MPSDNSTLTSMRGPGDRYMSHLFRLQPTMLPCGCRKVQQGLRNQICAVESQSNTIHVSFMYIWVLFCSCAIIK
ncbi:hypothetical protein HD806DRAFT_155465 [Xylariaceae sp. AK1471]|nr:hypothetical protein HD806DRAFT_155465 [Xylariaceae sp. AK1471]